MRRGDRRGSKESACPSRVQISEICKIVLGRKHQLHILFDLPKSATIRSICFELRQFSVFFLQHRGGSSSVFPPESNLRYRYLNTRLGRKKWDDDRWLAIA